MIKTDFFENYDALDFHGKKPFRKRLIQACMIEPPTWYSWIQKKAIPKPSQKLISIELGQDISVLFPNN